MKTVRKGFFPIAIVAVILLGLMSCSRSSSGGPATLTSVSVIPGNRSNPAGTTRQFIAAGTYSDGTSVDMTSEVTWVSANTAVASISGGGLATAIAQGTALITATTGSLSGSTNLIVTAATLSTLTLTPTSFTMPIGLARQFSADGNFSDGTTYDLTSQVSWSSSDASVATIDGAGRCLAVAAGTTTITASRGTVSAGTTLTVTPATLTSITVSPAAFSMPKAVTKQFIATGTYSDGTSYDITAQAAWTSANTAIAGIDGSGLATAVSPTATTVTAEWGGSSGNATLTVTNATLNAVTVTPANLSSSIGDVVQFTAMGTYSDGTSYDITNKVVWTSSDTTKAIILKSALAAALAPGSTSIAAWWGAYSGWTTFVINPQPAGTISTSAGIGLGDGGSAAPAWLRGPYGVAIDASGSVYIADTGRNVIRKVDANRVISTVVGNGTPGYTGDDGPAAMAELRHPTSVLVDGGNLYIADTGNNCIRKVDASGTITTVAGNGSSGFAGDGGDADLAELNGPTGVALDASENIYIADSGNHSIRKVDAATGTITTVVGNGTYGYSGDGGPASLAQLFGPHGVAVDSTGNLYIADTSNNRIRRVDAATGIISTLTGTVSAGYYGDGIAAASATLDRPYSVAVAPSGDIYIADTSNNRIRKVDLGSGFITTVTGTASLGGGTIGDNGPATAANLGYPSGIAVDAAGNLYIADTGNNRIRKVDTAETITTFAGAGGPSGDNGPATAAMLGFPSGIAFDQAGNTYIADTENNSIRKIDATTGTITTIAGSVIGTAGFSGDGGLATSAELDHPFGIAVDAAGALYIADTGNNRIRKVDLGSGGTIMTVAGNGTAGYYGDGVAATDAALASPSGVAVDPTGNIYIADTLNNRIRMVNAAGTITTYAGIGTPGYYGDGAAATSAKLYNPFGVALDASGNLYIADTANNSIRKVNAGGVITTVAGNGTPGYYGDSGPAVFAELNRPAALTIDSSKNIIYIADTANNRIREVYADTGKINTLAGTGLPGYSGDNGPATSAQLSSPSGVAIAPAGNVFISDTLNNRIRKVD